MELDNFQMRLPEGLEFQDIIRDTMGRAGVFSDNQSTAHRDIRLIWPNGQRRSIEAKNEHRFAMNLALEVFQGIDRRPSGLAISTADYGVHWVDAKKNIAIYLMPEMREWLRRVDEEGEFRPQIVGDNLNGNYLVPKERLKAYWWFDVLPLSDMSTSHLWPQRLTRSGMPISDE